METDSKMYVVTTEQRENETATEATKATTVTVGIQKIQTATPVENKNSDHGGVI